MTLLIGAYMTWERLEHEREGQVERGQVVADNLAMAAELALFARDLKALQRLCESALLQSEVIWAGLRDSDNRLLTECGTSPTTQSMPGLFRAAVGTIGIQVSDFPQETQGGEPLQPMGWVEVCLSLEGTLARQREILNTSLAIILGGLLISLIAALRIGTNILDPLLALSEAMTRYRGGDRGIRIKPTTQDEIGDLTRDFNRMAEALESSQLLLRQRIEAATAELQQSVEALSAKNLQLEAAHQEAIAAGQEKQEFLARMSHEIRTPLNAVIGFSKLLQSDAGGSRAREYTRTIDRAASQLLCVIDDILSFTRLESGRVELERRPFDLRACLEDVVAMLSPDAHEKGLELALVVHGDVPETLLGDPDRIAQVLMNLLGNAIKFTPAGHVFVEAGYTRGEAGQSAVRIVVSDTGIGLSEEMRARLFEPFVQADSSITRRFGGTGLGLIISKRLVELMGGNVSVESQPGKGSRFCFSIPCASPPRTSPALEAGPLAGRKVLVYDRQPIQLRALRTILVGWSMEVFGTRHSNRVPAILKDATDTGRPFEMLVLGLDGRESRPNSLERWIMQLRAHYSGPILLLVGTEHWTLPTGLVGEDALEWSVKPVRRSLLDHCLCRLIGQEPNLDAGLMRAGVRPRYPGLRVLVAEDNAFNRLLMRDLLELRGVDVSEAKDGLEAIAATRRSSFDLIFLDIHMPGMDGMATARAIRSEQTEEACPMIVALSADVFMRGRIAEQGSAFDGFLLKPVSETTMDETLRRAFAPSTAKRHSTPIPAAPEPSETCASARLSSELQEHLKEEVDTLLGRLATAIADEDRNATAELAHELKGLCGFFGMSAFETGVGELVRAASGAPRAELQDRLQALKRLRDSRM
jgi:two-component system sensor histidine kinase BarA